MLTFPTIPLAAWLLVVIAAQRLRGWPYAAFATVMLGIHTLLSTSLYPRLHVFAPVLFYLQGAAYLHFLSLVRARPRPLWWRIFISMPGMFFVAGTFLGWPWVVAAAVGHPLPWPFVPYALALFGVAQSLWTGEEVVDIELDGRDMNPAIVRPHPRGRATQERPLHIVQISDPRLGPFMSEQRLRRICERAVARAPDLVLLTGDFLTMESQSSPDALGRALAPLSALPGRCFACRGNHDLEAPAVVAEALRRAGVRLLIDEEEVVSTAAGPVQVLGVDFTWRGRAEHLAAVCARNPRRQGHLRVVMLHDPGAFRHLPHGEGDIVLSGHTHGGQLGLLSLGLPWTIVRGLSSIPDHGLWARGRDRLYVHRGTGHYGFPLRIGVPGEQSLLRIHWATS